MFSKFRMPSLWCMRLSKRTASERIHPLVLLVQLLTILFVSLACFHAAANVFVIGSVGTSYWKWQETLELLKPGSSAWLLLGMVIYCLLASLTGCFFLLQFFDIHASARRYLPFIFLAGFVPGYLIFVSLNRLVTLAFPNQQAFYALCVIYPCIVLYGVMGIWKTLSSCHQHDSGSMIGKGLQGAAVNSFMAVAILGLFLINQVQVGGQALEGGWTHVIGDGAAFFLDIIKQRVAFEPAGNFPVFTQHYDEIMFLYPLLQPAIERISGNVGDITNLYWVLYAFGKASCFVIAVLSIYFLSGSKWLGIVLAALLFFGSLHPVASEYYVIFDSNNPLGNCLHIGRVILSVMPFAIVAIVFKRIHFSTAFSLQYAFFLLLFGIGLSSLSSHFVVVVVASLCMSLLMVSPPAIHTSISVIGMCMLALIGFYAWEAGRESIVAIVFIVLMSLATMFAQILPRIFYLVRHHHHNKRTPLLKNGIFQLGVLFLGIVLGLALLGNMFIQLSYSIFSFPADHFMARPTISIPMQWGKDFFCDHFPFHCASLVSFIKIYGLPFILAGVAVSLVLKNSLTASLQDGTIIHPSALLGALAFCLATLVLSFFIFDFMNGNTDDLLAIWIKSRLMEPWFYCGIVLAVVFAWTQSTARNQKKIMALLVFYLGARSIFTTDGGIVGQWIVNSLYVYHRLF